MQLPALARFPVALCLFDAGQSSDAERRRQPVAEKQGGLGAQLSIMSLHPLPSVVPAPPTCRTRRASCIQNASSDRNARGSIVSIIKVTQATVSRLLAMRALTIFRYGLSCALVAAFCSTAPSGVGRFYG